jgi:hypothetical protein
VTTETAPRGSFGSEPLEKWLTLELLDALDQALPLSNHVDPFAARAWRLRVLDLQREIAIRNGLETERLDPLKAEPTIAPLDDAWLEEIAQQSAFASRPQPTNMPLSKEFSAASASCAMATPQLLTEIQRLKDVIVAYAAALTRRCQEDSARTLRVIRLQNALREARDWVADRSTDESTLVARLTAIADNKETP